MNSLDLGIAYMNGPSHDAGFNSNTCFYFLEDLHIHNDEQNVEWHDVSSLTYRGGDLGSNLSVYASLYLSNNHGRQLWSDRDSLL